MGKKVAYLHIGTMKTGTSSIQNAMERYKDKLVEKDISAYNNSIELGYFFLKEEYRDVAYPKVQVVYNEKNIVSDNIKIKLEEEFETIDSNNIIISNEALASGYSDIEKMKQFLLQYVDEIKIIVYFRNPSAYFSSNIQQVAKSSAGYDLIVPKYFKNVMEQYIQVFGRENIIVKPFDKTKFLNGNLLEDFFNIIKPSEDFKFIENNRENEAMDDYMVGFMYEYNKIYPMFVYENGIMKKLANRGIIREVASYFTNDEIISNQKPEYLLNAEDANNINEEIDYINELFDDGYKLDYMKVSSNDVSFKKLPGCTGEYLIFVLDKVIKVENEVIHNKNQLTKIRNKLYNIVTKNNVDIIDFQAGYSKEIIKVVNEFFLKIKDNIFNYNIGQLNKVDLGIKSIISKLKPYSNINYDNSYTKNIRKDIDLVELNNIVNSLYNYYIELNKMYNTYTYVDRLNEINPKINMIISKIGQEQEDIKKYIEIRTVILNILSENKMLEDYFEKSQIDSFINFGKIIIEKYK